MKDPGEPLTDPGRRTGDEGDAAVEAERDERVDGHGGASYDAARRRTDATLVIAFFCVVVLWAVSLILGGDASFVDAVGAVLLVAGSTAAIALLLKLDRERAAARSALADAAARADLLFRSAREPMWVFDARSLRLLDVNDAASLALGWSRAELLGMTVAELQVDASPSQLRAGAYEGEWRHRRKDGGTVLTTVSTRAVRHSGRAARMSIVHDLTAERDAEARTKALVDSAEDAIFTIDLDGRIESANRAAAEMFGTDLVGLSMTDLVRGADGRPAGALPALGGEVSGVRRDGTVFPLELKVTDVSLGDRTLSTVVARDTTERAALERRLTTQATQDPLTGLPNRLLFIDRLGHALAQAERSGRSLAVLLCDIDRFKVVNDSLGHTAGDALLFTVAGRLRDAVRTGDTVARFGGDEFMILAENLDEDADALRVAEQVMSALDDAVRVGAKDLHLTASIGIAVGRHGDTVEELVRDADAAMYRAKRNGRARIEISDAALRQQALERLEIEDAMRAGLGEHEFIVHYQPEVELATGHIVGLEALVRWERPGDGTRNPAAFLPVAEETGLIVPLGESVLGQACREAARWHEVLGEHAPTVWVNVSARQLASPDLVPMVEAAVTRLVQRPSALGLEITETDIVPDDELSRRTMDALLAIGVKLAIDDFGTGFASLSYLWRFPAHVVKIDQSFVRRMEDDREAFVLVKGMIDMAHSLGKTVVAEGVEHEAQLAQLRELGCDTVQGFLIARPQPATAIDSLLMV